MPAPSNPILPATWEVPQLFRDRLGKMVGRQRMMTTDGHLLLVLHAPPERDHDQRQARLFWRKPDGSWSSNANGSGIGSLIKLLDEYDARLDKLEEKEQIADTLTKNLSKPLFLRLRGFLLGTTQFDHARYDEQPVPV